MVAFHSTDEGLKWWLTWQDALIGPYGKRTADITGTITLPEGVEMVMPGDNVTAVFELISPIAMEPGLRFALREGGRTVGAGVVSKIIA